MTIEGVPVTLALVSGGLAAVNPCGFPLQNFDRHAVYVVVAFVAGG